MLIERVDREIAATSEEVWAVLADLTRWPDWHPGLTEVIAPKNVVAGSTVEWRVGGRRPLRTVVVDVEKARRLVWIGGPRGLRAVHVWSLEPTGNGTRVVNLEVVSGLVPALRPTRTRRVLAASVRWSSSALDTAVSGNAR